jgi:hypothetical protein
MTKAISKSYLTADPLLIFFVLVVVDSNLLLVPSQVPESEEESTEFLNVFFVFLNSRTGKSMDFWFDQFKRIYLTLFYPRVFKELGLLPQDNSNSFYSL